MNRTTLSFVLAGMMSTAGVLHAANAEKPAAKLPESQQIDALLAADWKANNLKPNPPAPDDILVRRLYLDIVGRIPTERETQDFLSSKDPDKKTKLIDRLLGGEGYVQNFFNYWADILRAQSNGPQMGSVTGVAYTNFIKESLRSNKPYDQFVRDMIGAQGKAWDDGAIGYYMRDRGMPLDNMATTVRVFLGTRIECAQCHNHPFDKWSQRQFYEMAAFTYGVETYDYNDGPVRDARLVLRDRENALRMKLRAQKNFVGPPDPAELQKNVEVRQDNRHMGEAMTRLHDPLRYTSLSYQEKKLRLPHDYKYPDAKPNDVVKATTMMGKPVECQPGAETLQAYAAWMTSSENPRFTTLIANRLWKKVFGLGLIEPVDEMMDNTVAMNPGVMKRLEKLMVDKHYDMKAFLRVLFNTQAYQASVTREEVPAGVNYHFTGPVLRRMTAEQMWDSFVALINPTPDMVNLTARDTAERRLAGARKYSDAVDNMTPEEIVKGAERAAVKYREQASRLKEIQEQLTEARAADDKEKIRDLNKQSNELQRNALKSVNDNILIPAVMKLAAKVSGKSPAEEAKVEQQTASAVSGANDKMMMMGGDVETNMAKIPVAGYDKPKKTDEELKAEQAEQRQVMVDEANYYGIPEKQQAAYIRYRQQQEREWLRSAEIESPAPRGHYLREFGQSDREFVQNANTDASVPQVLVMMNSQLLPKIIEPYSQLMLTINKAKYPDDQVEAAYLTLLSRKPTDKERRIWVEAQDKGLSSMEDLIYALINTQQFIFIQ